MRLGCVFPVITRFAPSRAQRSAISRPIPRLDPVMNIVLPRRLFIIPAPFLLNRGPQMFRGKIIDHYDLAAQRIVALQLQSLFRTDQTLVARFGNAQ